MRNTFKYFTSDIVKILYPVYIRLHLEFAAPVWNALSKDDPKRDKKLFNERLKDTQQTWLN